MTNQDELNQLFLILDAMKRDKEYYEKSIRKLIADKDLPTESRWNLFTAFCRLFRVGNETYVTSTGNKEIDMLIEAREPTRGELITADDILNWCKNSKIEEKDVNEFKECWLNSFTYSFANDW